MVIAKVDGQGRLVIPAPERKRLGVDAAGSEVRLISTSEGLSIEPVRDASLVTGDDGMVAVLIEGVGTIAGDDVIQAIHDHRDVR